MIAAYVAPVRCRYARLEACAAYWKAVTDLGLKPSVPLVSVLVAHGALECGNFEAGLWNNNPGNIKAGATYAGKYTCIVVNEILKNPKTGRYEERWFSPEGELVGANGMPASPANGGRPPGAPLGVPPGHPQTRMRAFDTLDDGLEDKIRFLFSPNWRAAFERAVAGDASGFVRALRARNYFTAYANMPANATTPYEATVVSLERAYRPLVEQVAKGARPRPVPVPLPPDPVPMRLPTEDAVRLLAVQAFALSEEMDVIGQIMREGRRDMTRDDDD